MIDSSAHKKYEFKKKLEELREKSGRGTELISLYIPHDKQISDVVAHLRDEYGQASNIKSKLTRTNVQSAIDSLLARLKYIPRAPENGIVIFCGAVDIGGNKTDMETIIVEPPDPIVSYKYHCDSSFYLEPLEEMLKEKKTFGLLVMDRREATIGLLRGKHIEILKYLTSNVPGKQRKGGQSSRRFERLRIIAINEFYKRIGESASEAFLPIGKDLIGVLIGGPSPTKEEFIEGEYLHHEIQKKIIDAVDVSYTDESGLYELVDSASSALHDLELTKEKKSIQRFMKELVGDNGLASYGEDHVRKNLQLGAVDVLLLSEDLRKLRLKIKCTNCDFEKMETIIRKPGESEPFIGECPICKSNLIIEEKIDIIDELSQIADQMGTKIEFISTDFEEGEQLFNAFGGIAAILRFKTGV
ncbi:MAG TPA: peptide chain release factor 1, partial [Methanosarcinales archaeon]|nr:peptide chain release factor 1 [Methanosarcinales archaeon]